MASKWEDPDTWRRTLGREVDESVSRVLEAMRRADDALAERLHEMAHEERLQIALAVIGAGRQRLRGPRREEYVRRILETPALLVRELTVRGELPTDTVVAGEMPRARALAEDAERLARLARSRSFSDLADRVEGRAAEIDRAMKPLRKVTADRRRFVKGLVAADRKAFLGLSLLDTGSPPGTVWTVLGICLAIREGLFPLREERRPGTPEARAISLPLALEVLLRSPAPGMLEVMRARTGETRRRALSLCSRAAREAIGAGERVQRRVLLLRVLGAMGEEWLEPVLQPRDPDRPRLRQSRLASIASQMSLLRKKGIGDLTHADVYERCEIALMTKSRTLLGVMRGNFVGKRAGGADRAWVVSPGDGEDLVPAPRVD